MINKLAALKKLGKVNIITLRGGIKINLTIFSKDKNVSFTISKMDYDLKSTIDTVYRSVMLYETFIKDLEEME